MAAVASGSRRVPQGEVIMDFADGGSYSKSKLEDAVVELERKRITKDNERKAAKAMEALNVTATPDVKDGDVELIMRQLGCTRSQAQDALKANKGDLVSTLLKLVQPRARAKSFDAGGEKKA